jgi:hypothetical protein
VCDGVAKRNIKSIDAGNLKKVGQQANGQTRHLLCQRVSGLMCLMVMVQWRGQALV